MKVFIDRLVLEKKGESFLKTLIDPAVEEISLSWPSLLEVLEIKLSLDQFPYWDDQNPLSSLFAKALREKVEKEFLFRLYDQVFVESLTQVKALSQLDPVLVIRKIQEKKKDPFFEKTLGRYETLFRQNPYYAMHDLTLYLAWDRVCVYFACLFDDVNIKSQDLKVLRECLIESFQHITKQGKAVPGLFRLIEALYAYDLREENLQTHKESEWLILSKGSCALKPREVFLDVPYIDACLFHEESDQKKEPVKIVTLDCADRVRASLSLSLLMIKKLREENFGWCYSLKPVEVVCLREQEDRFLVGELLKIE